MLHIHLLWKIQNWHWLFGNALVKVFGMEGKIDFSFREHYLEKIAIYLSRCGLQSNSELIEKGYPDLGWDPVEGERYLDFLRFCVWVNMIFCNGLVYILHYCDYLG